MRMSAGLAEEDVGANVLVLGDLALLRAVPRAGTMSTSALKSRDGVELPGDAVEQVCRSAVSSGWVVLAPFARDQAASGQAGREAPRQQADEGQVRIGARRSGYQSIVGSGWKRTVNSHTSERRM